MYQVDDFNYELDPALIAQFPLPERTASRLMYVDPKGQAITHHQFSDVLGWISPKDLLVLNNTKVIRARLFGQKDTGGKIECMIERILNVHEVIAQLRVSKAPKVGSKILLENTFSAEVLEVENQFFRLRILAEKSVLELLEEFGKIPLPPYIARNPDEKDLQRYQTVFAKERGAVAAPTAGLHFDTDLLEKIARQGTAIHYLTLHVGAGTFLPVRVADINQHQMHSEWMVVDETLCEAIRACKARGGRVIAVGTTVVRALETASQSGEIKAFHGETSIFIRPGYQFQCVDTLITNLHLPKSTLLMLVSAFAGFDLIQKAYHEAVSQKYRFFSYGDAMILFRS